MSPRLPLVAAGLSALSLAADVTASAGAVVEPVVEHVPQTGGWRLYFEYRPGGGGPAELAARLMRGDRVMTETWRFTW